MMVPFLSSLMGLGLTPRARAFRRSLENPQEAQARVRQRVAQGLMTTAYGRSLALTRVEDFGERVPVVDYSALLPWVEKQKSEEGAILFNEPVLFYEKTSGSTGPCKYIPYTRTLKQVFGSMFQVWLHDLCTQGPGFRTGKVYLSVSPQWGEEEFTERGRPVGLKDDTEYLSGWMGALLRPFWVGSSGAVSRCSDAEAFLEEVTRTLVMQEDLEVISVWNPLFLKTILDRIHRNKNLLTSDLALSQQRRQALWADPILWTRVWPHLRLISCWREGHAAPLGGWVEETFPGVLVQGKGLLATEAPVTVPLLDLPHPAPLVDEVLMELEDLSGHLYPLTQGREGESYSLVISVPGGFVRYRLGDRVRVGPFLGQTPALILLGRGEEVSDLAGEKLHADFVAAVLASLPAAAAVVRILIPVLGPPHRYILLVDALGEDGGGVASRLEQALLGAHHYRLARDLGQLEPAGVQVVPELESKLAHRAMAGGARWGGVKPRALYLPPLSHQEMAGMIS